MHLRELAQDVAVQRDVPFPRQHAVETRHQLHALLARELAQRRERRASAPACAAPVPAHRRAARARRVTAATSDVSCCAITCFCRSRVSRIRIEREREQQRACRLRMTAGRDDAPPAMTRRISRASCMCAVPGLPTSSAIMAGRRDRQVDERHRIRCLRCCRAALRLRLGVPQPCARAHCRFPWGRSADRSP